MYVRRSQERESLDSTYLDEYKCETLPVNQHLWQAFLCIKCSQLTEPVINPDSQLTGHLKRVLNNVTAHGDCHASSWASLLLIGTQPPLFIMHHGCAHHVHPSTHYGARYCYFRLQNEIIYFSHWKNLSADDQDIMPPFQLLHPPSCSLHGAGKPFFG